MSNSAGFRVRVNWFVVALVPLMLGACGGHTENTSPSPQPSNSVGGQDSVGGESNGGSSDSSTQISAGGGFPGVGGWAAGGAETGGSVTGGRSSSLASTGGGSSTTCGNGYVDYGEDCDDGNTLSGDGCSANCKLDDWNPCPSGPCIHVVVCADGKVEGTEACDDGNLNDGDGCSSICSIEPGYICPVPGRLCQLAVVPPDCGDGIIESNDGELCDEGSLNGKPGHCPSDCGLSARCGNGVVEPYNGEQCDDGINDNAYGACSPGCMLAPYCGDGIVNGPEVCDFGTDNAPLSNPGYGTCLQTCRLGPHCGDGVVQTPYELCDLGSLNGPTSICSLNCLHYDIQI
jgi:cysteine-rich repeat protein